MSELGCDTIVEIKNIFTGEESEISVINLRKKFKLNTFLIKSPKGYIPLVSMNYNTSALCCCVNNKILCSYNTKFVFDLNKNLLCEIKHLEGKAIYKKDKKVGVKKLENIGYRFLYSLGVNKQLIYINGGFIIYQE